MTVCKTKFENEGLHAMTIAKSYMEKQSMLLVGLQEKRNRSGVWVCVDSSALLNSQEHYESK